MLMPAIILNSSPATCEVDPVPNDPRLILAGLALASAMRSAVVGAASRRKADDPAQRPRRVGLCAGARQRTGRSRTGRAGEIQKSTARKIHGTPSCRSEVLVLIHQLAAGDRLKILIIDFLALGL